MTVAQGTPDLNAIASVVAWLRGQEWVGDKPTRGQSADAIEHLTALYQGLSAQVVELQKDAKRYQVVHNGDLPGYAMMPCVDADLWNSVDGDKLDAMIDSTVTRASVPPSVEDSGDT